MARKKILVTAKGWEKVLDEVSNEIGRALEEIPKNNAHRNVLMLFVNTLQKITELTFDGDPEYKEDIKAFCGMWMNIGILYGHSPEILLDILKRTGATGFYDIEGDARMN